MRKQCLRIISENVGVYPVLINSALVSAQNRDRYYWSNIRTKRAGLFGELHTDIPQPADRGIVLRDILESEVDGKYFISGATLKRLSNLPKTAFLSVNGKAPAQRSSTGRSLDKKHNYQIVQLNPSTESQGTQPYQQNRVYDVNYKSPALMAEMSCCSCAILRNESTRRLTPTECARLQTVPAWYRWDCSDTQEYKMLGNGWTIEVIKHILSYLPKEFFNKQ
ncbi:MAG: DNA cytosine methyltransferase, partial [Bacteroidales bacterium]|jgi:DNA (cytosine-5)-methyltransferase 3A|nr:DNA cytosine methyltransferase [Bacteroidales bacterium]